MTDIISEMLDFSLFKDRLFLIILLSNIFTSFGFVACYIYIPDRAVSDGISEDLAALLISALGIATTVSRFLLGWLSNQRGVSSVGVYATTLTLCGVCTILSPFCHTFPWMLAYSVTFGFLISKCGAGVILVTPCLKVRSDLLSTQSYPDPIMRGEG